jgi:hypothetical protein
MQGVNWEPHNTCRKQTGNKDPKALHFDPQGLLSRKVCLKLKIAVQTHPQGLQGRFVHNHKKLKQVNSWVTME